MKVILQRVTQASVSIENKVKASIDQGLLILLGIENEDTSEDISWLCKKILNMRIFNDENEVMNLSLDDIQGEILLISQFTLHASTKKGNRPSYIKAAKPDVAIPLYKKFIQEMQSLLGKEISTGTFGADMKVSLLNDGPVTIIIDSKNRE
ncbi:D-tyrosyl-tRNA(Tyr) deacylase [Gillisia sp. Hel1_33_143]|uniref:D-aminoacyl-tRNA deacylase n=1 Tax=Gillisia sp. Hel1_33_143 TaxID=1336796 RepID=UPI0008792E14|nr:D-aminoacyl-tRNA deacylase [Gillisia sp. Hel1_33_143]SDS17054.1 D-tyrosyl-tRNA(Tyr) deacylase [Gillisia sp. Hel1_33_143]